MKIGLQMFSVRDYVEKDMAEALRRVADIGYQGVEFAGYGGLSADRLTALLDSLHMEAGGTHVDFNSMANDTDYHFGFARDLGLRHIAISVLGPEGLVSADCVKKANEMCEKAEKYGLTLSYHNHTHEFEKAGGKYLYDNWMEQIPQLCSELDVCWVVKSGLEPVEWMKKYADRLHLIHLKELPKEEQGKRYFPAVGDGNIDFPAVLRCGSELGCDWAFVELDECLGDTVESAKRSRDYLRKIGY